VKKEAKMANRPDKLPSRILRFLGKPACQKLESIRFHWRAFFPAAKPTSFTLPFGAKWVAEGSALDRTLQSGGFEKSEVNFVQKYLQTGMTVLDIGAHHGLYTLLASVRVGETGRVISFEPSPRERTRLERHIHLNECSNVKVETLALGSENKRADLFLVEGPEDYCNSLRPPAVEAGTRAVKVEVTSVDEYLSRNGVGKVDFIKLDTEGAERDVLKGASGLLRSRPQPVVMSEIAEIRTAPWGYSAREILSFMEKLDYEWFSIEIDGTLQAMDAAHNIQDTNLVAVPKERREQILRTLGKV
jgi:FkbM family methyltransferase